MKRIFSHLSGSLGMLIAFSGVAFAAPPITAPTPPHALPEPGTMALVAVGGAAVGLYGLIKKRRK